MNAESLAINNIETDITPTKKPEWIRVKLPTGKKYTELRSVVDRYNLHTICTSGSCPNMGECWGEGTATFMILGNICTHSCEFYGVKTGRPESLDWEEPEKVARSIKLMNIKHCIHSSHYTFGKEYFRQQELPSLQRTIGLTQIRRVPLLQ